MLIIADTSALVALAACRSLHLLDVLFGEVRVPPAVLRECTVPEKPGADVLGEYLSGKVAGVQLSEFVIAATGLGQGELEAMALYRKLSADRLLVDDQRARKVARFNRMAVIGSVGVLFGGQGAGTRPGFASAAGGHSPFGHPHQRCAGRGGPAAGGRGLTLLNPFKLGGLARSCSPLSSARPPAFRPGSRLLGVGFTSCRMSSR